MAELLIEGYQAVAVAILLTIPTMVVGVALGYIISKFIDKWF